MKYLSLFICICLTVLGCGDSDPNAPTLNDIAGVWDATTEEDGRVDESYVVISPSGEYTVYDYQTEGHYDGSDCYEKLQWSITDLGDGLFELSGDDIETVVGEIELSGDQLTVRSDSETVTMVATELEESDLVPVCIVLTFNVINEPTVTSGSTEGFTMITYEVNFETEETLGTLYQDTTSTSSTTSGGIYIYAH